MKPFRYAVGRKFTRYSLDVRAKLIVDGREITVRTLDVSEGGVGLVSPVEIPEGKLVVVECVFPTVQGLFRAELQAQNRSGFRYGFQFVALDKSNAVLLRKYERRWGILAKEN
jgi:hypothetical protein